MQRLKPIAALLAISLAQGCVTAPPTARSGSGSTAAPASPVNTPAPLETSAPVVTRVASVTEVAVEKNAPAAQGHPLTSVVVTQCNLIVAVYMTMPDGRLLRLDHSAQMPADQLLTMAYTATRSERVEVSCNDTGAAGYEHHDPV